LKRLTRILLIDDDEDDAEIFGLAIAEISDEFSLKVMHSASEALKSLSTKELQPEVIFLDLNMPVMNGQTFLREIKKNPQLASIPVVIFSTSSQLSTMQLTRELGAQSRDP
jgi:CheY-like chemotaxis protein